MTPGAQAAIGEVLRELLEGGVIASPDDASLYAMDEAIRSNQGAPNPWVVDFFGRAGIAALAFVRPAPGLQEILRTLAGRAAVPPGIAVVRAGSAAALERALLDRGSCLVRGTGPDGDALSIAACGGRSIRDALAEIRRIAEECRRAVPAPPRP